MIPIPSLKEFSAGGFAGMAQVLAGHPLDTIKTRLQLSNAYKGPLDCLVKTIRVEGVFGLFKGMGMPLVGISFVNALLFSAYGWAKTLQSSGPPLVLGQIALAGSFAGFANAFVAGPIELLKIRSQMNTNSRLSTFVIARKLVKEKGVAGLYRGTVATIVKEIPAYAGFYAGFEGSKRMFAKTDSPTQLPIHQLMISGSVGGMAYWICCYPLDVVKCTIQRSETLSTRILPAFASIYSEQGFSGFFKGFGTSLLRSIPAAAATFTVYELSIQHLDF